jgi:hypothetical protein
MTFMTRTCEAFNCRNAIANTDGPFCPTHWALLPKHIQAALVERWKALNALPVVSDTAPIYDEAYTAYRELWDEVHTHILDRDIKVMKLDQKVRENWRNS